MDTTAEGAETHDELTLIRDLGCSHIQGYIFGRPMAPEDAGELAAQNKAVTADGFQFNRPPRQGILKVASVQWNGMTMPVRVRNISTGGALLESSRTLPPESSIQLDLPGCGHLGAEVRWAEGKRMGVQFEQEFDLRLLAPGKTAAGFGVKLAGYAGTKFAEGAVGQDRSERRRSALQRPALIASRDCNSALLPAMSARWAFERRRNDMRERRAAADRAGGCSICRASSPARGARWSSPISAPR